MGIVGRTGAGQAENQPGIQRHISHSQRGAGLVDSLAAIESQGKLVVIVTIAVGNDQIAECIGRIRCKGHPFIAANGQCLPLTQNAPAYSAAQCILQAIGLGTIRKVIPSGGQLAARP